MDIFTTFPSRDDGPQGKTWTPVAPGMVGAARTDTSGKAFKLSVYDEENVAYRFLMTREALALMVFVAFVEMSPWLAIPASWWWRAQRRIQRQAERSSGIPSRDGSPQEGQAV